MKGKKRVPYLLIMIILYFVFFVLNLYSVNEKKYINLTFSDPGDPNPVEWGFSMYDYREAEKKSATDFQASGNFKLRVFNYDGIELTRMVIIKDGEEYTTLTASEAIYDIIDEGECTITVELWIKYYYIPIIWYEWKRFNSITVTVVKDNTPPEITIVKKIGEDILFDEDNDAVYDWANKFWDITAKADDGDGLGVLTRTWWYRLDQGDYSQQNLRKTGNQVSIYVENEGIHTIEFFVQDKVSNQGSCLHTYKIDKTNPVPVNKETIDLDITTEDGLLKDLLVYWDNTTDLPIGQACGTMLYEVGIRIQAPSGIQPYLFQPIGNVNHSDLNLRNSYTINFNQLDREDVVYEIGIRAVDFLTNKSEDWTFVEFDRNPSYARIRTLEYVSPENRAGVIHYPADVHLEKIPNEPFNPLIEKYRLQIKDETNILVDQFDFTGDDIRDHQYSLNGTTIYINELELSGNSHTHKVYNYTLETHFIPEYAAMIYTQYQADRIPNYIADFKINIRDQEGTPPIEIMDKTAYQDGTTNIIRLNRDLNDPVYFDFTNNTDGEGDLLFYRLFSMDGEELTNDWTNASESFSLSESDYRKHHLYFEVKETILGSDSLKSLYPDYKTQVTVHKPDLESFEGFYLNFRDPAEPVSLEPEFKTTPGRPLTMEVYLNPSLPPPITYLWNFGDGTASSHASSPVHAYFHPNLEDQETIYNLTLTVTDGNLEEHKKYASVIIRNTDKGRLFTNEIWGGEHILSGDVLVPAGIQLGISDNTDVKIHGSPVYGYNHRLTIEGKLKADPGVSFYMKELIHKPWRGILLKGESENLSNITIRNAEQGLVVAPAAQLQQIQNCIFQENEIGVRLLGSEIDIILCEFLNNHLYGIKEDAGGNPRVTDSLFRDNTYDYYDEDLTIRNFQQLNGLDNNSGNRGE